MLLACLRYGNNRLISVCQIHLVNVKIPSIFPHTKHMYIYQLGCTPGQGAQYVGMADKYLSCSSARDVFKTARAILGYDLLKLCQNGIKNVPFNFSMN